MTLRHQTLNNQTHHSRLLTGGDPVPYVPTELNPTSTPVILPFLVHSTMMIGPGTMIGIQRTTQTHLKMSLPALAKNKAGHLLPMKTTHRTAQRNKISSMKQTWNFQNLNALVSQHLHLTTMTRYTENTTHI